MRCWNYHPLHTFNHCLLFDLKPIIIFFFSIFSPFSFLVYNNNTIKAKKHKICRVIVNGIYNAKCMWVIWAHRHQSTKLKMHSVSMAHWEMFGLPETHPVSHSLNLRIVVMPRMRFVVWMDRKFNISQFSFFIFFLFETIQNVCFCSRCCGTRIRVEMSSGRSRRDDRKGGGRGGGGGGGGRNRYRYVYNSFVVRMLFFAKTKKSMSNQKKW